MGSGSSACRWIRMEVHGQSFLLNQIRKMVGLALAVYRGSAPRNAVRLATDPTKDFGTPMAPELGLLLRECCYASYNRAFGAEREELTAKDYEVEIEKFVQVILQLTRLSVLLCFIRSCWIRTQIGCEGRRVFCLLWWLCGLLAICMMFCLVVHCPCVRW
jgi:hypothetical protein